LAAIRPQDLRTLDTNKDGKISAADSAFASLQVWQDTNGNGGVDTGEIQSLTKLGIASISLNANDADQSVNGNRINAFSTFTRTNGTTGQAAEVYFNNNKMDAHYTGTYTLNPATLLLPNLRGYGTAPDLYIAMSKDPTLLKMVRDLVNTPLSSAAGYNDQVAAIIYRWTGVDAVIPGSRGRNVNAKSLKALEVIVGENFLNNYDGGATPANPNEHQGSSLSNVWNQLVGAIKERLLIQGPLASFFSNAAFNYSTDAITGAVDLLSLLTAVGKAAPTAKVDAVRYWANIAPFVDAAATDLNIPKSQYDSALQAACNLSALPVSLSALRKPLLGSDGDDILSGDTTCDYIDAAAGNDIIQLWAGQVAPGEGVNGGMGYDKLAVGGLNAEISGAALYNMEELDIGYSSTVYLASGQLDAFSAIVDAGGNTDTFYITGTNAGTYSLAGKSITGQLILHGSSGNDTITGSAGADTLFGDDGNDVINGGAGDDAITGGVGADTINGGDGNDTIFLWYGEIAPGEKIDGGAGYDKVSVGGMNVDLKPATFTNVEELDVVGNSTTFVNNGQLDSFKTIVNSYGQNCTFYITADGAGTYSLSGKTIIGLPVLQGTAANEILIGSAGNDTICGYGGADRIDGGGGADTLIGDTGNDTYIFNRTYGATTVTDYGGADVLLLGANITRDQMWFSRSGNDLVARVIGTGAATTIKNWYTNGGYQIEKITTADAYTLSSAKIQNLVNAMASLSTPSATTLSAAYHQKLDSVIAASWTR
jgi:Ca2+-binding RTX toxin-like protein